MAGPWIALGNLASANGIGFNCIGNSDIICSAGNRSDKKKHDNIDNNTFCLWSIWIFNLSVRVAKIEEST